MDKIALGTISGIGTVFLEKHKWDCDWYWGFGYIGNSRTHFHIDSLIDQPEGYHPWWTSVNTQFEQTWLTQDQWWILRDLFISAYALKKVAEVYRYGGHQTESADPYRIISVDKAEVINKDLEHLLDRIWWLLEEWVRDKD